VYRSIIFLWSIFFYCLLFDIILISYSIQKKRRRFIVILVKFSKRDGRLKRWPENASVPLCCDTIESQRAFTENILSQWDAYVIQSLHCRDTCVYTCVRTWSHAGGQPRNRKRVAEGPFTKSMKTTARRLNDDCRLWKSPIVLALSMSEKSRFFRKIYYFYQHNN